MSTNTALVGISMTHPLGCGKLAGTAMKRSDVPHMCLYDLVMSKAFQVWSFPWERMFMRTTKRSFIVMASLRTDVYSSLPRISHASHGAGVGF